VAETHPTTEAHGGEEHGAFPPFEPSTYGSQLLWLAITFGLLYWAVSRVALPRIGGIMEERDNRIGADLAQAQALRGETDAAIARYEQALAEARQRAQRIAGEARDRSKADTEAERRRLEAEVNGRMEQAEARIADVKSRALSEVDVIARDATEAIVIALLGSGVSPQTIAGAVNAAMAERTPLMDPTQWATFWAFMALLVFLGLLVYLKLPGRIVAALDDRSNKIRTQLEDARRLREEAQALLADYQRRRSEAESEAEAIVSQARREADALTEEARIRMQDFVTRRTKAVEDRIAQAEAQAVSEVRNRAVDVATAAAARILGNRRRARWATS
jgi:F-type H+-transporting ATPase subunit b